PSARQRPPPAALGGIRQTSSIKVLALMRYSRRPVAIGASRGAALSGLGERPMPPATQGVASLCPGLSPCRPVGARKPAIGTRYRRAAAASDLTPNPHHPTPALPSRPRSPVPSSNHIRHRKPDLRRHHHQIHVFPRRMVLRLRQRLGI